MLVICTETTQKILAERRQAASKEQQRRQFEQAPGFIIVMRGPEHVVEFVNDAHRRLFGSDAWVGKTIREAFPSVSRQGFFELLDKVYATGETYSAEAAEVRFTRTVDGPMENRYLTFIYAPITAADGIIEGIFCEGFDATEARQLEEHRRLLGQELVHRMKNTMAMVTAIVNQSFRDGASASEARAAISNRISVLAHAHEVLTQASWTSAPIHSVVEGALAAHRIDGTRFRVAGPALLLAPRSALSLALVVNELATNATKYGAVSVAFTWQVREAGQYPCSGSIGGKSAARP